MNLSSRFNNLNYSYDCEVDVLYCKIRLPYIYDYTIPVTPIFNIDICEKTNRVVAFELLDASKILKLKPEELKETPNVKFTVQITKDIIKIICNIMTVNGGMAGFSVKALNEDNASPGLYYYYT